MDPFARKMWQGSFVYGGIMLVMFAVLTGVYLHTRPRCSDRLVAESADQNKQWIAAVMERRCGEDTPFFTHVNLRPAGKDLKRGFFSGSATEGEVFQVELDAPQRRHHFKVGWWQHSADSMPEVQYIVNSKKK